MTTQINIFEKAARVGLRLDSTRGQLSVEDLWKLPLTGNNLSLDGLAVDLFEQLQKTSTKSFVNKVVEDKSFLQLKFDIVKHIIDVKVEERDKVKKAKEAAAERAKLMDALANRQQDKYNNMSEDDILKRLGELEGVENSTTSLDKA